MKEGTNKSVKFNVGDTLQIHNHNFNNFDLAVYTAADTSDSRVDSSAHSWTFIGRVNRGKTENMTLLNSHYEASGVSGRKGNNSTGGNNNSGGIGSSGSGGSIGSTGSTGSTGASSGDTERPDINGPGTDIGANPGTVDPIKRWVIFGAINNTAEEELGVAKMEDYPKAGAEFCYTIKNLTQGTGVEDPMINNDIFPPIEDECAGESYSQYTFAYYTTRPGDRPDFTNNYWKRPLGGVKGVSKEITDGDLVDGILGDAVTDDYFVKFDKNDRVRVRNHEFNNFDISIYYSTNSNAQSNPNTSTQWEYLGSAKVGKKVTVTIPRKGGVLMFGAYNFKNASEAKNGVVQKSDFSKQGAPVCLGISDGRRDDPHIIDGGPGGIVDKALDDVWRWIKKICSKIWKFLTWEVVGIALGIIASAKVVAQKVLAFTNWVEGFRNTDILAECVNYHQENEYEFGGARWRPTTEEAIDATKPNDVASPDYGAERVTVEDFESEELYYDSFCRWPNYLRDKYINTTISRRDAMLVKMMRCRFNGILFHANCLKVGSVQDMVATGIWWNLFPFSPGLWGNALSQKEIRIMRVHNVSPTYGYGIFEMSTDNVKKVLREYNSTKREVVGIAVTPRFLLMSERTQQGPRRNWTEEGMWFKPTMNFCPRQGEQRAIKTKGGEFYYNGDMGLDFAGGGTGYGPTVLEDGNYLNVFNDIGYGSKYYEYYGNGETITKYKSWSWELLAGEPLMWPGMDQVEGRGAQIGLEFDLMSVHMSNSIKYSRDWQINYIHLSFEERTYNPETGLELLYPEDAFPELYDQDTPADFGKRKLPRRKMHSIKLYPDRSSRYIFRNTWSKDHPPTERLGEESQLPNKDDFVHMRCYSVRSHAEHDPWRLPKNTDKTKWFFHGIAINAWIGQAGGAAHTRAYKIRNLRPLTEGVGRPEQYAPNFSRYEQVPYSLEQDLQDRLDQNQAQIDASQGGNVGDPNDGTGAATVVVTTPDHTYTRSNTNS